MEDKQVSESGDVPESHRRGPHGCPARTADDATIFSLHKLVNASKLIGATQRLTILCLGSLIQNPPERVAKSLTGNRTYKLISAERSRDPKVSVKNNM